MSKEQITSLQPAPSPSNEVILNVNLTGDADRPMEIKVSQTIFKRMANALEERGIKPEFVAAGAVIFVAAATTAGVIAAKKAIERSKEEREVPKARIPILNEEQQRQFNRMYQDSYPLVYSYIRKRLAGVPVQDVEDLTQRVFERALRNFPPKYTKPNLTNRYLPWLYTITRNMVLNRYARGETGKKEVVTCSFGDEEFFPRPKRRRSSVESIVISREEEVELQKRIASLADPYPLVVWLKSLLILSNKEIADILGKTESAIKAIFNRARRKLKEE